MLAADEDGATTLQVLYLPPYLTQSVFEVVSQKLIPTQFVKLFFILVMVKDTLADLWGS